LSFIAVNSMSNPLYIVNFTSVLFKNADEVMCLNMSGYFPMDMLKATFQLTVKIKQNEDETGYDRQIFTATVDACKLGKGVLSNFVVKIIMDQMKENSNWKFSCPSKAGPFYVKDFAPPKLDMIPPAMLSLAPSLFWEVTEILRAKVKKSKSMVHIYTIKLEGEMKR
jgi:Protein of unknown function (DUF1091)